MYRLKGFIILVISLGILIPLVEILSDPIIDIIQSDGFIPALICVLFIPVFFIFLKSSNDQHIKDCEVKTHPWTQEKYTKYERNIRS